MLLITAAMTGMAAMMTVTNGRQPSDSRNSAFAGSVTE